MEKPESHKKILDPEVTFIGQAERKEVLAKLSTGVPVMFILAKDFRLHLGSGGHENIRFSRSIEW
jgi:hypothetical protein